MFLLLNPKGDRAVAYRFTLPTFCWVAARTAGPPWDQLLVVVLFLDPDITKWTVRSSFYGLLELSMTESKEAKLQTFNHYTPDTSSPSSRLFSKKPLDILQTPSFCHWHPETHYHSKDCGKAIQKVRTAGRRP